LQRLTGDALVIWGDAQARRSALEAIVTAWEQGDEAATHRALRRVDDAVVAGLRALDLPRGPIGQIRCEPVGRGWRARKLPSCDLVLDAVVVRQSIRHLGSFNDVFRTWVHESIHARQPFSQGYQEESRVASGYEEGLAEGLARLVTRDRAGIAIREQSYTVYVAAYQALADVLAISAETLWRGLWELPPGGVRRSFLDVVVNGFGHLTNRQLRALRLRAETVFATSRAGEVDIDRAILRREWERTLS
jgi:hypothetical protein